MNQFLMKAVLILVFLCGAASGQSDDIEIPAGPPAPPPPVENPLPELISPASPLPVPSTLESLSPGTTLTPSWSMTPIQTLDPATPASGERGWFVRGETMFLHLSRNSSVGLVDDLIDSAPGMPGAFVQVGPVLTTNDISNQSFQAVPRATLGYQFDSTFAVEATYFSRNDWSGSASLASSPLGNPSVIFLESPDRLVVDSVGTSLSSKIQSLEANAVEAFENNPNLTLIAGLRCFGFAEQFQFHTRRIANGDLYTSNYNLQSTNNLYGAQLGLRWGRTWNRLSITGTGKSGLYVNDAAQYQFLGYAKNANGFSARDGSVTKPTIAFVQELGANAKFQISKAWSIRAGYNFFVISGIGRVGDQIDFSLNSTPAYNVHGTAVLHGPSAGLELRF